MTEQFEWEQLTLDGGSPPPLVVVRLEVAVLTVDSSSSWAFIVRDGTTMRPISGLMTPMVPKGSYDETKQHYYQRITEVLDHLVPPF